MGEVDTSTPVFYYKENCPHSMSLLEILSSYQRTFPSMRNVPIDQAPADIMGTPAIRMSDGQVHYGDHAFEFVRTMDESRKSSSTKRVPAPLAMMDAGSSGSAALKPAAESMVSAEAAEAEKKRRESRALDTMFGQDVIMPRHN